MRIALVSTYPPSQGSLNEYAYHFVAHLRQKPEVEEVILLVDELPANQTYSIDDIPGSHVAALDIRPCWRFNAMNNLLRIRQAVQATKPDVVLFNIQFATFGDKRVSASLGLLTPALVHSMGLTTVVLLHNIMETVDLKRAGFGGNPVLELVTRTFGTVFTRLLLLSDLITVTIPKYVEILQRKYNVTSIALAPHGAFQEINFPSFDLPPGPLQIMTFGKFGTYKKVETLIEAFQLLQAESSQPLELVIAGGNSPNTPGYLENVQRQYAHVNGVRFLGYVAEEAVPQLFIDAAVAVFPYNSTTGSSGVLHQAGSFGKAVVLPQLGDFAELIAEEGYTGEFFEPENPRSLADAIARLVNDPDRRRECGTQNYLAASGLPMSEVVDWYLLHFERFLNMRKAAPPTISREVN